MKRTKYTAIGQHTPEVCIILWEAIARREAEKIKRKRKWQWLKNQTKRLVNALNPRRKQKTVFEWTKNGYVMRKEEA